MRELKSRDSLTATNKAIDAQAQLQMNTELQVRVCVLHCVTVGMWYVHMILVTYLYYCILYQLCFEIKNHTNPNSQG